MRGLLAALGRQPLLWPLLWVLALSGITFVLMGLDKSRARRGGRRVPEKTFFLLAALGGAAGGVLGMWTFRHKTRHRSFQYGLPALLLFQLFLSIWVGRYAGCW